MVNSIKIAKQMFKCGYVVGKFALWAGVKAAKISSKYSFVSFRAFSMLENKSIINAKTISLK
jgi:hypothetical protein